MKMQIYLEKDISSFKLKLFSSQQQGYYQAAVASHACTVGKATEHVSKSDPHPKDEQVPGGFCKMLPSGWLFLPFGGGKKFNRMDADERSVASKAS